MTKVLLIVDAQPDFMPGGKLAVAGGDEIVPVINKLIKEGGYDLIVASQDWHPANHGSFASQHKGKNVFDMGELSGQPQVMWPDHCVQGTDGAKLHNDLLLDKIDFIQQKGMNPEIDSYSAFADNAKGSKTGLDEYLKSKGVTELHVCGLATDYCVAFSAMDAAQMLKDTKIKFIEDASRGISENDINAQKDAMKKAGIETINSDLVILPSNDVSGDLDAKGGEKKVGK